jgi:zinc protease
LEKNKNMKQNIQKANSYSLATITQQRSDLAVVYITVDIHGHKTAKDEALQIIYADALLSGAGKLNREQFLDAVNKLGASVSVSISEGRLNITLKSQKSKFSALLKLTELILLEPTFSSSELKRIKQTVVNVLHHSLEDSKSISLDRLLNVFYGASDRKFSYEAMDITKEVNKINKADLLKLHRTTMSQPWTCSMAADKDETKKFVDTLKKLKRGQVEAESEAVHQQKTPFHTVVLKDIPSRSNIDINIGAPLPITLQHPDYLPLSFGISVLAKWGGFSGRLMSTVREKEGLTYSIYGKLEGFVKDEQGYWRIMTFFAPDKAVQGINSTIRELTKIFSEGITKDEFEKFQTILKTQQTLLNDSVYGLLNDLHSFHCQGFTLEEIKEFKGKIDKITIQEVNRAIKTYLNPNTITISGAGPIASVKKDIERILN